MATDARAETTHATLEQSTGARTLGELILRAGERIGVSALRDKQDGAWVDIPYDRLAREARAVARGLIGLGIQPGDRVAILGNTRPEWVIADLGCFCAAAVVAPIYHTNSPEECRHVLAHSDARVVFCEDAEQVAKVASIRDRCPALEHIVVLEGVADDAMSVAELCAAGAGVPGDAVDERVAAVDPHDTATLIYTSGTTGPPKGCILTHDNFLAAVRGYEQQLDLVRPGVPIVFFMFLPLAHALARVVEMAVIDLGGTLAFWQRDPAKLLDDIREIRPTYLPSVPRVFEKIHTTALAGVSEAPLHKRAIFHWSIRTGARVRRIEHAGGRPGPLLALRHRLADRLVLSKVRDLFGGRLALAASGAAPIAKEVLEFFDACGVLILEGWGMTETAAAGTINTEQDLRFGTVGRPLPGTEVRVGADRELFVRGPTVFRGYFKDEEATAEVLDADGWLSTGDLAEIDADGFVSIVGRKKDLIITSSGKNISPTNIENALKATRWISQAVVFGDNKPYLVALLSLDPDEAPKLAEKLGVDPDLASMAHDPRVLDAIGEVVAEVNEQFARIEQIKRFTILERDLSQSDGELTPTLKVKRAIVAEEFAEEIAALYERPA
jgi:long-chain acyl-CoA synthetase